MLSILSLAVFALISPASAPPIVCEISMGNWCIVQLPSTIEMREAGNTRSWIIKTAHDTARAEVRIDEDKFCDGELTRRADVSHRVFRFEAAGEHCGLTVSVSSEDHSVSPEAMVRMLIMFKGRGRWQPVHL